MREERAAFRRTKTMGERKEKGFCVEYQNGFYELLTKPRMRAIYPDLVYPSSNILWTFHGRILQLILALYVGMLSPVSGRVVLRRGDKVKIPESYD
jgi:hypothetical protein